jgi:hypothetical protein
MKLEEFRQKFPQYHDLSDRDLADRLYERHYSDMPRAKFNEQIGYTPGAYEAVQEEHPVATDVVESLGRGVKRGAVDLAGLPGTAASLMNKGIDYVAEKAGNLFGVEMPKQEISEFGTPEYINQSLGIEYGKARTKAGEYAEAIGENIPAFAIPGAGAISKAKKASQALKLWTEKPLAKLGTAALAGTGEQIAGDISDNNPWARAIGGGVGGLAAGARDIGKAIRTRRANLAKNDLAAAADAGYDLLRASRQPIADTDLNALQAGIILEWRRRGLTPRNSPTAYAELADLVATSTSKTQIGPKGIRTTVGDLVNTHAAMGHGSPGTPEMIAGQVGREKLEDFMEKLDPNLSDTHREARANWAAHARHKDIETALEAGKERGATTGRGFSRMNPIRQEIRRIFGAKSKQRGGFSKEAQLQAAKIIEGNIAENIARFGEIFAPYDLHRALGSLFVATLSAKVAIPMAIGGAISKTVGDFLTEEEVRKLMDIVAEEAPANKYWRGRNRAQMYRARLDLADKVLRATSIGYSSGEQRDPELNQPIAPPPASRYGPRPRAEFPSFIGSAQAASFKPLDPSNPDYTNPGGHEKRPVVENPGRAAPATSVPPRYRESTPNAKYYQKWTPEELAIARKGQVPPGRTANQMHRQRQLQGFAEPRTPAPVSEESQSGFSREVLRGRPRVVIRPEGAGQLPGDISTTEDVLANPEGDPLQ